MRLEEPGDWLAMQMQCVLVLLHGWLFECNETDKERQDRQDDVCMRQGERVMLLMLLLTEHIGCAIKTSAAILESTRRPIESGSAAPRHYPFSVRRPELGLSLSHFPASPLMLA
jgi:hypothetical protein